jgi:glycosyltransferase involved in cell wall biosynthesis
MKKIVQIVEATATGTLSIAVMVTNIQAKIDDLIFIYSRRAETPENIERLFLQRIPLIEENLRASNFPFSIFRLRKQLNIIKPDIIHCHSSFAGFIGRIATLGLNTKVFYSPHCISFMRKDISKFKILLFKLFETVACLKPSTYIACSESEEQAIRKALPFAKVKLLENAVDLTDFTLAKASVGHSVNETIKVITVGGIRPQKGPKEYAQIATQFKNKQVEFIWIGDGDIEQKQVLLDAGVTVTGWMSREEVIAELYKADVYVSTALWEGMPVSIIEACAAHLPVIARNCDGNKDIISSGNNGYLFDETKQCIDLLDNYLAKPAVFEELARHAHDQVFTRFSVDRFAKKLDKIYKN